VKILIASLLAILATGCAGDMEFLYDTDDKVVSVKFRNGEQQSFIPETQLEEEKKRERTRAEIIVLMGEVAGDSGLGAELVIIAEQYKASKKREAHENSLRVTAWIHEQEERESSWRGTERRSRRAFGEYE